MRLVPESNFERIQFFLTHLPGWVERAEEIGTTPEAVAELQAATEEARDALKAQQQAQMVAQSATLRMNSAIERMSRSGAAIVHQIRARAMQAGEGIYPLASIPAPKQASPIAPPGKPERIKASLSQDGTLTLTWRCKNPRGAVGTMYQVSRQTGVDGPFVYLATVGEKRFVDMTIPPGTTRVMYKLQAVRTTSAGAVSGHIVNFGTDPAWAKVLESLQLRGATSRAA
jgi:hypothetical protein